MAFCIFFKCGSANNICPISVVLCDQGRSLFLSDFKREADARCHRPEKNMRNGVEKPGEPYGVVGAEAPTSAPNSLTVVVPR